MNYYKVEYEIDGKAGRMTIMEDSTMSARIRVLKVIRFVKPGANTKINRIEKLATPTYPTSNIS